MSSTSREHGTKYLDMVFLHALHALPGDERPAVAAHIAECAECRREVETLRPLIGSFVAWPTDDLCPSASLWDRLAQRLAAETGEQPALPEPQRWADTECKEVAPGLSCKLLATDTEKSQVSMLVRLAPGTDYPPHRHAGIEELYMLDGVLNVGDEKLYPGDYRRADADTVDHRIWSETGCSCVLITSLRDVIF